MGAVSEPKELPRPPQTTMVGWVVLIGSVYVALQSFDSLASLRSSETRELIEDMIKAMGRPAGVSVEDGITALRGVHIAAAVCAAASAVLAFFALRRDKGARIGLSVLAVPLALSAAATGGFMTFMVVAGVLLLWLQPARNWFNGLPPVEMPSLRSGASTPSAQPSAPSASDRPDAPAPTPYGSPYGAAGATGSPDARAVDGFGVQPTWQAPQDGAPAVPDARPREVTRAGWVTIAFSAFAMFSCIGTLAYLMRASEGAITDLFEQVMTADQMKALADEGIGITELVDTMAFAAGVLAMLSLLGVFAGFLALKGAPAARGMLLMLSAAVLVFSVIGMLTNPVLIVMVVAAGFVLRQVTRPHVVAWFRAHR